MPATITRFAPSPTGRLHIGGARTALFCWAFANQAKQHDPDSVFLLRIEDTDRLRSSDAATQAILEALAWIGIGWDEGPEWTADTVTFGGDPRSIAPFNQADRLDLYNNAINQLIQAGRAYPAFETQQEIEAARDAAKANKQQYRYDRAALNIPQEEAMARVAAGEDHVVRFRMPDEPITVRDKALGDVTISESELDDFIIRKRDGFPTYHLAVVVDDAHMGVTHVLRGQEHLINTPRHVALQQAMGVPTPEYAHMTLIFNPDGSKMSKRDKDKTLKKAVRDAKLDSSPIEAITDDDFVAWLKDKTKQLPTDQLQLLAEHLNVELPEIDVDDFRASGYLPEALTNYLALLGWNPKAKADDGSDLEFFDLDYLAANFNFAGLSKAPSKFDRDKLLSFNADRLQNRIPADEFAARWRAWAAEFDPELCDRVSTEKMSLLAPAIKQRCKTFKDVRPNLSFALVETDSLEYNGKAVRKNLHKNEAQGLSVLADIRNELAQLGDWSPGLIHAELESFGERTGVGMGGVAQPIRVAIAGVAITPPLGETLAVLGRETTLQRIDRCIEHCQPTEAS